MPPEPARPGPHPLPPPDLQQRPLPLVKSGASWFRFHAREYPALFFGRVHSVCPDGLLYRARHDPSRFAVAIFERAAGRLQPTSIGSLADREQRDLLADILDHYGFGLLGDLG